MIMKVQKSSNLIRQATTPITWAFVGGMIFMILFIGIHFINTTLVQFHATGKTQAQKVEYVKIHDPYSVNKKLEAYIEKGKGEARVKLNSNAKTTAINLHNQIESYITKLYLLFTLYIAIFTFFNFLLPFYYFKNQKMKKNTSIKKIFEKYGVIITIVTVMLTAPVAYFIYEYTIITPKVDPREYYKLIGSIVNVAIFGLVYGVIYSIFAMINIEDRKKEHLRGTQLKEEEELEEYQIENKVEGVQLTPKVKFDRTVENENTLLLGAPGVGKTVEINRLIKGQIEYPGNENAKFIINELKIGTFTDNFYNPETDYYFDPGLKGSIIFNPFDYIFDMEDLSSMVDMLTLDMPADQKDPGWRSMATGLLSGIVALAKAKGQLNTTGIREIMSYTPDKMLAQLKKIKVVDSYGNEIESKDGVASAIRYLSAGDTQVGIYLGVFESKMQFFKNLQEDSSQIPLNLEEWLYSPGQSKLFILTRMKNSKSAEIRNATLIATMFEIIMSKQNTAADMNRRFYFYLDELGNLGKIPKLEVATSLGRSYGISVVAALQSLTQIDFKYEEKIRQTLVDSMGNYIFFRVGDPKTAKWISEKIGKAEELKYKESTNYGVEKNKGGGSSSEEEKEKSLVLESEIMKLPKFKFYFTQPTLPFWSVIQTEFITESKNGVCDIIKNPHGDFVEPEKIESLQVDYIFEEGEDLEGETTSGSEANIATETVKPAAIF